MSVYLWPKLLWKPIMERVTFWWPKVNYCSWCRKLPILKNDVLSWTYLLVDYIIFQNCNNNELLRMNVVHNTKYSMLWWYIRWVYDYIYTLHALGNPLTSTMLVETLKPLKNICSHSNYSLGYMQRSYPTQCIQTVNKSWPTT